MGKFKTRFAKLALNHPHGRGFLDFVCLVVFIIFLIVGLALWGHGECFFAILSFWIAFSYLALSFVFFFSKFWKRNLPEYKLEEAIKKAVELFGQTTEMSSPLVGLVKKAKQTGQAKYLTDGLVYYQKIIDLRSQMNLLKKKIHGLPRIEEEIKKLFQKIKELEKRLNLF